LRLRSAATRLSAGHVATLSAGRAIRLLYDRRAGDNNFARCDRCLRRRRRPRISRQHAGVNEIAPQDRRAAMMSIYFVCVFCGNALPVIGVGVVSTLTSSLTATLVFAATVSLFALIALRLERR